MSDAVADASAIVLALAGKSDAAHALRARWSSLRCHAPHLVDAEVGNVLRRHERARLLTEREARAAVSAAHSAVRRRYPVTPALAERAWQLRHNLTFYDALYVALAAALDVPLLTADARLQRAAEGACGVELV